MSRIAEWQDIPTQVLEDQRRSEMAETWATQQRAQIAQQWADTQRQQAMQVYAKIIPPAPTYSGTGSPDDQAGYGVPPGPFRAPFELKGLGGEDDAVAVPEALPVAPVAQPQGPLGGVGDWVRGRITEGNQQYDTAREAGRTAVAEMRGGGLTPATADQAMEAVEPLAMAMTPDAPRKAAGALGAATVKATAEELARLRLDKFPEAVRDTIQQASESGDFWRTQRRGVIPDAEAEEMADRLGRSVDQVIAGGKAGSSYNIEETRAVRNAYVAQAVKVNELAAEIAKSPHQATPEMLANSLAEGMKLADISKVAEGARAEAGRSLRAYQAFTRDFAKDPAGAVERITKAIGGPVEAQKAIIEYNTMVQQGADAFALAKFWAKVEKPPVTGGDWFRLLRYNAMLSGPRTLLINTIGNTTEIPWRLARDTAASLGRGRPEELRPEMAGIASGFRKGIGSALDVLAHGVTEAQVLAGDLPREISARVDNPVAKKVAQGLEVPGRLLQATDEIFRQTAYGMALGRSAGIEASKAGLRGDGWSKRVDEIIASPSKEQMTGADAIADRMTYKGEMGGFGEGLQTLRAKMGPVGDVMIPFLRTVYHITSRGVDRSPLGAVGTIYDVAKGKYSGGKIPQGAAPLGERAGDNLMGSIAFAGLGYLASQGLVSGQGPDDTEKRKMLQAQGWQPYSIKMGDRWVGYQNWGPMAVPMSLAAALIEAPQYRKETDTDFDVASDTFARGAKLLTEQSYLQGVGAIYKGITDPGRYGEKFVEGVLQTLVPYGAAINTVAQATDPVMREPEKGDVAGSLRARIPGLREGEPARQDVLGREVANQQQGLAAVNPIRSSPSEPNAALRTLQEAGVDVGAPPKELRSVPLTPAEQRRFQQLAGKQIEDGVAKATASPRWGSLPAESKEKALRRVLEQAREVAGGEVLRGIGGVSMRERLAQKKG